MNTQLVYTNTKSEVVDWIGESGDKLIGRMTDQQAEKLLDWLKSENIDIEKDMDKISAHLAAISLGKRGGSVKSERKAITSRENGKKGGRPSK
jgi:hypothetical protein